MPVWDLPTRLFHWLAIILVLAAWLTERLNWMDWHAFAGKALLALLLFRLAWGVVGSDTARFARFVASPRAAALHLARLFHREPDEQIGHNAAGGWMVCCCWRCCSAKPSPASWSTTMSRTRGG